ncbi:hypothetical protein RhiJN_19087 [Ceratobasidium sp. AG-Ba]|nr:hypothetical protein RhiJN_04265 [Ceratobasidium sp. AG-Ba]QRV91069.1 hypothetical protein RhiJN_19087 [Ceratobasidium sp. AG-Ba]QRW05157.1 hypothetical protein RhiLY_04156 [Ceratobasidium sp. AG-Ba]
MSSNPTTPSRPEGLTSRLKSFRSPTRAFTMGGRPASPTPTGPEGRPTPTRSSTRDSSPSTTSKTRSLFTSPFTPRNTDAVNTATDASKTEEPASIDTPEPAKEEAPSEPAAAEHTPGHIRARSGSTVSTHSSHGPLTPPLPSQVAEPAPISKADADPNTDSAHDGASIASSRSPSRLRRQVSNLSRRSISGSIRRLSLLGPGTTSPPAVETTPAIGEMETRSRSPSISDSVRRLAASPEPAPVTSSEPVTSEPEPIASESPEPQAAPVEAPQPAVVTEAPIEHPVTTEEPAPIAETSAPVEAPAAPAPAPTETPKAEAPKPTEPQTPSKLKPSMSRNASTTSLTKSPEKPEPKRRSTLTNWARRSLDRKPSGSGPSLVRPPSRNALSGDESDTDSLKERERGWNTGRAVPPVPEPKKSDDNLKRRFGLGRRSSTSNSHTKTPSESASESEKKPNWASKVLRVGSKSKKDKSDSGSFATSDSTAVETAEPVSISDSRPSLTIAPPVTTAEPAPLSVIAESPAVQLGPGVSSLLANTAEAMKGIDTKPAEPAPIPEVVETPVEVAPVEPVVAVAAVVAEPEPVAEVEATPAPVEPEVVVATIAEEVQPAVTEEAQPKDVATASGTATPAQIETNGVAAPPENMMSPMSPNSPSSTPWDPIAQREIARAVSPRRASAGGPSNRSRVPSPAPSIIGVKRKAVDEPDVSKGRVRYLPNWAVSPAIQLAVTLSLVLPRRRRDVANPANRRSKGWWPFRRSGPRTELRYNAIRGVNEEVPVVSRSWTVPAVVRTTAKVVTAPARLMFRLFVPRSSAN